MSVYRARVEYDYQRFGVLLHTFQVAQDYGYSGRVRDFGERDRWIAVSESAAEQPRPEGLHLQEDEARAVYEALAEYFGGTGHDTRALRRDYDAERARVDKLIGHLTR